MNSGACRNPNTMPTMNRIVAPTTPIMCSLTERMHMRKMMSAGIITTNPTINASPWMAVLKLCCSPTVCDTLAPLVAVPSSGIAEPGFVGTVACCMFTVKSDHMLCIRSGAAGLL
jgi:hypothetical protein